MRRVRNPERGSAMLVTLILVSAMLAGAVVLVSMQLASNRSTEISRASMTALYCAEAGLSAARPHVAANQGSWVSSITASAGGDKTEPVFLQTGIGGYLTTPTIGHDLDGDGIADFVVYLKDNDDELTGANDAAADVDGRVFIVARCIKFADVPKEVMELVEFQGGAPCLYGAEGGCTGQGNTSSGL